MAWEIERHHVDVAEMVHVTHFVNHAVRTRNGEPARHLLQIRLGAHLQLQADGSLHDAEGKPYDVKAKQQEILARLNELHERAHLYARKHGAQIRK